MVLKSVVHRLCLTSLIVALASGQTIRNDALHNHLGAFDTESGRAQLRPLFSILMGGAIYLGAFLGARWNLYHLLLMSSSRMQDLLYDHSYLLGTLLLKVALRSAADKLFLSGWGLLYDGPINTMPQVIYCIVSLLLMHSLHHLWSTRMRQFLHWGWGCCHIRDSRNQSSTLTRLMRFCIVALETVLGFSDELAVCCVFPIHINLHQAYSVFIFIHDGGLAGHETSLYWSCSPCWIWTAFIRADPSPCFAASHDHERHRSSSALRVSLYFRHWFADGLAKLQPLIHIAETWATALALYVERLSSRQAGTASQAYRLAQWGRKLTAERAQLEQKLHKMKSIGKDYERLEKWASEMEQWHVSQYFTLLEETQQLCCASGIAQVLSHNEFLNRMVEAFSVEKKCFALQQSQSVARERSLTGEIITLNRKLAATRDELWSLRDNARRMAETVPSLRLELAAAVARSMTDGGERESEPASPPPEVSQLVARMGACNLRYASPSPLPISAAPLTTDGDALLPNAAPRDSSVEGFDDPVSPDASVAASNCPEESAGETAVPAANRPKIPTSPVAVPTTEVGPADVTAADVATADVSAAAILTVGRGLDGMVGRPEGPPPPPQGPLGVEASPTAAAAPPTLENMQLPEDVPAKSAQADAGSEMAAAAGAALPRPTRGPAAPAPTRARLRLRPRKGDSLALAAKFKANPHLLPILRTRAPAKEDGRALTVIARSLLRTRLPAPAPGPAESTSGEMDGQKAGDGAVPVRMGVSHLEAERPAAALPGAMEQDDDFGCHPLDAASGWILLQDSAPLLGSPPASPGAQPSTTGIATGYATATASVGFGSHSLEAATGWVPLQCPAPLTACPAASPGPQPPASDTAGPDLGPRTPGFASFCHSGATPRKGPRVPAMFNFLEGNGPSKRNEERVELRWEMGDEPSAPAPTPTQNGYALLSAYGEDLTAQEDVACNLLGARIRSRARASAAEGDLEPIPLLVGGIGRGGARSWTSAEKTPRQERC